MNIIKIKVDFTKRKIKKEGVNLVEGDFNSTKLIFEFDKEYAERKVFELAKPNSTEAIFVKEIINNEVILTAKDENENDVSIFSEVGKYPFEISLYGVDSKLTSINDHIAVKQEMVKIEDEEVERYLPIFDELMQELNEAQEQTNNLNLEATKQDTVTTVKITKKDGTIEEVRIYDGQEGPRGISGQDGYTPVKGVDYFDGQDGFSPDVTVTETQTGATISITDQNGTTTAEIRNGEKGEDGYTPVKGTDYFDGQDGHTPVKGVDYFTPEDIASLNIPVSCNLGQVEDYTTTNRLDLGKLKKGVYLLDCDGYYSQLYVKATYKGNEIEGSISVGDRILRGPIYLIITKEINDDLPERSYFAEFQRWLLDDSATGGITFKTGSIQIYDTYISSSSGSLFPIEPVTRGQTQNISGKKTFTTLPESSLVPTNNNQLVNKKYVDDTVGNINSVLESIISGGV